MKRENTLEEYDKETLEKAYELIYSVYEYNYGAPNGQRISNRLETILKKVKELIEL